MNRLQQIPHIVKKDIRQRWPEIASVLVLIVLLALVTVDSPDSADRFARFLSFSDVVPLVYLLLPVAWCVLIARAVHSESLPGREQMWLTRPYDRTGLMLAKLALVMLCVHLPLIAAHAVVLYLSGLAFPISSMVISQLVLFAVLTLPAMAVATLTRSLGQFVVVAVGILIVLLAVQFFRLELQSNSQPSGWGATSLMCLFLAASAVIACAWQYWTRRTRPAVVVLGAMVPLVVLLILVDAPRDIALGIELRLSGKRPEAPSIALGLPVVNRYDTDTGDMVHLLYPLVTQTEASNGPPEFVMHDWRVRLVAESGESIEQRSVVHGFNEVWILLPRDWVRRYADSPLQLQVEYVVDTYEETARHEVLISHDREEDIFRNAFLIDDRYQCGFSAYVPFPVGEGMARPAPRVTCRSAFLSPVGWRFDLVRTGDGLTGVISHEKGVVPVALDPIVQNADTWTYEGTPHLDLYEMNSLPVIVRERATLQRGQIRIDDIVLSELPDGV